MSDLTLDVGLAVKLKKAFMRNGWTEKLIDKACEGNRLDQFREVLLGNASITLRPESVIDCDAVPLVPTGWSIKNHQKDGLFTFSAARVKLWFGSSQRSHRMIEGNDLQKELTGRPVLNANVLDYILVHQHLIPERWKGKKIFFWGTIYSTNICGISRLHVRCLCWYGNANHPDEHDRWGSEDREIGCAWGDDDPAVVRTS